MKKIITLLFAFTHFLVWDLLAQTSEDTLSNLKLGDIVQANEWYEELQFKLNQDTYFSLLEYLVTVGSNNNGAVAYYRTEGIMNNFDFTKAPISTLPPMNEINSINDSLWFTRYFYDADVKVQLKKFENFVNGYEIISKYRNRIKDSINNYISLLIQSPYGKFNNIKKDKISSDESSGFKSEISWANKWTNELVSSSEIYLFKDKKDFFKWENRVFDKIPNSNRDIRVSCTGWRSYFIDWQSLNSSQYGHIAGVLMKKTDNVKFEKVFVNKYLKKHPDAILKDDDKNNFIKYLTGLDQRYFELLTLEKKIDNLIKFFNQCFTLEISSKATNSKFYYVGGRGDYSNNYLPQGIGYLMNENRQLLIKAFWQKGYPTILYNINIYGSPNTPFSYGAIVFDGNDPYGVPSKSKLISEDEYKLTGVSDLTVNLYPTVNISNKNESESTRYSCKQCKDKIELLYSNSPLVTKKPKKFIPLNDNTVINQAKDIVIACIAQQGLEGFTQMRGYGKNTDTQVKSLVSMSGKFGMRDEYRNYKKQLRGDSSSINTKQLKTLSYPKSEKYSNKKIEIQPVRYVNDGWQTFSLYIGDFIYEANYRANNGFGCQFKDSRDNKSLIYYLGHWSKNEYDGEGIFYNNNAVYTGTFKTGKIVFGTLNKVGQYTYKGPFKDWLEEGFGVKTYSNGIIQDGLFEIGSFKKTKAEYEAELEQKRIEEIAAKEQAQAELDAKIANQNEALLKIFAEILSEAESRGIKQGSSNSEGSYSSGIPTGIPSGKDSKYKTNIPTGYPSGSSSGNAESKVYSSKKSSGADNLCSKCCREFDKKYEKKGDPCNYYTRKETKPGYVLCSGCHGLGYLITNVGCDCGWCYEKECYVNNCEGGWVPCYPCDRKQH